MAIVEDVRRSIWHAFTALAKDENGRVAKSRLKVLTNNIGRALGNDKAEEIMENGDADSDSLTVSDYFTIISPKLLHSSDTEPTLSPAVCTEIDKICWMLCQAYYHKNSTLCQSGASLNSDDLFKLWKLFNFLAKVDLDAAEDRQNVASLPLRVDVEEAHRIGSLIRQALGYNASDAVTVDPSEEEEEGDKFGVNFVHFVIIVCHVTTEQGLADDVMRQGINCIYEEILNDVIKKGYLEKFGNQVTNWKRRWFRLSAKELQYFTTDLEREMKGTIDVCKAFRPECLPQRAGHKPFRIKLLTATKSFELAAPDLRCKNEWITALQKASDYCGQQGGYQKSELMDRERARKSRRDKVAEELFGKSMMRKQLQNRDEQLEHELQERMKDKSLLEKREQELEAERLARLGVEARLAEEAAALEAERLRLKELEEIRALLERLLEEERQAKRDEEIVRGLQSRLLLEETEKREQLELLKSEQEKLLQQEREEKEGLERDRQEQEALLNKTQHQLNLLAEERQKAEDQIREAEEKMRLAELERHKMEERLRLREMSTSVALRQPKPTPNPDPFITHRGKGAFVDADFVKKEKEDENKLNDASEHQDSSSSSHAVLGEDNE